MHYRKELMAFRALVALGLCAALPPATRAGDGSRQEAEVGRPAVLDTLVARALERNPALQAARRRYEAARARVWTAWLPGDPMLGVDVQGQSDLFGSDWGNREYMVSQSIPFPTTLLLRGQLALRDAQVAYQEYKEEERRAAWEIEQPYYELVLAEQTNIALQEIRAVLDRLAATARARYESNRGSQQDLLKAQIEASKLSIELFKSEERARVARVRLARALDEPTGTAYQAVSEAPRSGVLPGLAELEQLALDRRPELRASAMALKRARTQRLLAVTSWLPDITGRIEAMQLRGEDSIRTYDTFIGVSVPVWSLLKGVGGEWRAAQRELLAAEAVYADVRNGTLVQVHEAYSKARQSEYALQMYESVILPQARQQVEVALSAYEGGREDFLSLLDAERTLQDTRIEYEAVRAAYEQGLSDLWLAIGGRPDRAAENDARTTP